MTKASANKKTVNNGGSGGLPVNSANAAAFAVGAAIAARIKTPSSRLRQMLKTASST